MPGEIRRFYRGDCLDILREYIEPGSVSLIYLDPPFNSNSRYNLPFKGRDKIHTAVEAFVDTWTWTARHDTRLAEFRRSPAPRPALATVIDFARNAEVTTGEAGNLAAYLLNMAERLLAMKPLLNRRGSVYLHCDPTASHYLKLMMDAVFGRQNFRNEIVWCYRGMPSKAQRFQRKHDIILFYAVSQESTFHVLRDAPTAGSLKTFESARRRGYNTNLSKRMVTVFDWAKYHQAIEDGKIPADLNPLEFSGGSPPMRDWWDDIRILGGPRNKERLGYPTQKPLALLERIIKASSNPGDLVLDPFCGCGTTVHAAEKLDRQWIGVDISRFSVGLMHERVKSNFPHRLAQKAITVIGLPETVAEARALAQQDRFEFEKWACGKIGANGMGKRRPGTRGADGGLDGIIELLVIRDGKIFSETAIVQIKSGRVSADSVRALAEVVRQTGAVSGIMLCFADQLTTVENQRSNEVWHDDERSYPVIQGFSIEDLLADKRPILPRRYGLRRGARMTAG